MSQADWALVTDFKGLSCELNSNLKSELVFLLYCKSCLAHTLVFFLDETKALPLITKGYSIPFMK